jgi:hypothetical protein
MPFRLLPEGLEEAQFKRIPEGWLFATISPWIFAPRRTYLVSDAQKPAIAARIRCARYLRLAVTLAMMILMVAVIVMNPTLTAILKTPSLTHALSIGAFGVLIVAVIMACDHLAVRSLLRDLPRSSQKISYADIMRSQSKAMSTTAIATIAALLALFAASQVYFVLTSSRTEWIGMMSAMACAGLAAYSIVTLIVKLRTRHAG